jgi:tetratricopeptide (TPR) repeat protein
VQDDAWLDRRTYDGELPAAAERALRAVGLAWDDEATAEGHLYEALALAPGHLAVQIAAYKFYFYRHRLTEALPYAQACLAQTQRRNQLPADWRDVRSEDAAFTTLDPEPRMFLFTLVAYGYVLARLGRSEEARIALTKVADLDPADRMGARRLLAVIEGGGRDDDA